MPVGVLRAKLRLRAIRSLKEKRGVLLPLLARLRNDLHCAAAEVEDADRWGWTMIEVACVNSDRVGAERTLRAALALMDGEAEVVEHDVEIG